MLPDQSELKALAQRFKCPILQERMQDPVMAADGHTYEREAITSWIAKRGARALSPMTGEPLDHLELQTNFLVKGMIEDYKASAPERKQRKLTQQDVELAMKLREEELEAMLAKQHGRIKSLETQQRDAGPSQMGPLERETLKNAASTSTAPSPITPVIPENRLTADLTRLSTLETQRVALTEAYSAHILQRALANRNIYRQLRQTKLQQRQSELSHQLEIEQEAFKQTNQRAEQSSAAALQALETSFNQDLEKIRKAIAHANEEDNDSKVSELVTQRSELRNSHENSKAVLKQQLSRQLSDAQQAHEIALAEKKAVLKQVTSAKDSKRAALVQGAMKIQRLTATIEQQKQALLEQAGQQQAAVDMLAAKVSQQATALQQRLNPPQAAGNCYAGLFQPAQTAHEQVTAIASSVAMATYAAKVIDPDEVTALLRCVAEGRIDEAEKLVKKTPQLALAQGTVTDLSGRTFERVTAFQYAVWALDSDMWDMLLKTLEPSQAALQLDALENDRHDIHQAHGKHFDFDPLLQAYQQHGDNYKQWSSEQRASHWMQKIGGAQRKVPAWYIYAFCEPGDKASWCRKTYSAGFVRGQIPDWWVRLGTTGAAMRGEYDRQRMKRGEAMIHEPKQTTWAATDEICTRDEWPDDHYMCQLLKSRQSRQLAKLQSSVHELAAVAKPMGKSVKH